MNYNYTLKHTIFYTHTRVLRLYMLVHDKQITMFMTNSHAMPLQKSITFKKHIRKLSPWEDRDQTTQIGPYELTSNYSRKEIYLPLHPKPISSHCFKISIKYINKTDTRLTHPPFPSSENVICLNSPNIPTIYLLTSSATNYKSLPSLYKVTNTDGLL